MKIIKMIKVIKSALHMMEEGFSYWDICYQVKIDGIICSDSLRQAEANTVKSVKLLTGN